MGQPPLAQKVRKSRRRYDHESAQVYIIYVIYYFVPGDLSMKISVKLGFYEIEPYYENSLDDVGIYAIGFFDHMCRRQGHIPGAWGVVL